MRNRTEDQIRLVMIRHGTTESNRERRYLGRTDEPLCEEGKGELAAWKREGRYPPVDALFASPMKRCLQTAAILYPAMEPVCIGAWREMDFGAFEKKSYEELKDDERYQRWIAGGGRLSCPEGEGREAFVRRCKRGFQSMMGMLSGEEKTVGMIVHGGTMMALLSSYGGGGYYAYQAANGGGYLCICEKEDGGYRLGVTARL